MKTYGDIVLVDELSPRKIDLPFHNDALLALPNLERRHAVDGRARVRLRRRVHDIVRANYDGEIVGGDHVVYLMGKIDASNDGILRSASGRLMNK